MRSIKFTVVSTILLFGLCLTGSPVLADLPEVKASGVLRHLGGPYANFVTGTGDGLDVELMQRFAASLGVRYEYVQTDFDHVVADLTGKTVVVEKGHARVTGQAPVRGDVVAMGFTILPWRRQVVDFSSPTFPTQVWLVTSSSSPAKPIRPSGNIDQDIQATRELLRGRSVLGKARTCLDPSLFRLEELSAKVTSFPGSLNELAPAMMNGAAENTMLDVPDSLVALGRWPGQVKVLGPLTAKQEMGCAFSKESPRLRAAFEEFLSRGWADKTYPTLVQKYYPDVTKYFPDFFSERAMPPAALTADQTR